MTESRAGPWERAAAGVKSCSPDGPKTGARADQSVTNRVTLTGDCALYSHEVAKVVHFVNHVWILLDYLGERLGINECDRKLLIEGVVVPVHLCQAEYTRTGLVPAARSRKPAEQDGRWRRP